MPYPNSPGFYPNTPAAYPNFPDPNVPARIPPRPEFPTLAEDQNLRRSPPLRDRWSFVVGPASGGLPAELTGARSRKVTFRLSGEHEASCELRGADPSATAIVELATDLHAFRRPRAGEPREHLFRGRIGKSGDRIDETSHTVMVPALDYRALLKRRRLMTGSQQSWANVDQSDVAWGLLTQAQNKTGGNYGIIRRIGTTTGVMVSRDYDLGDEIGTKIQELSETPTGFEWEIAPIGSDGIGLAFDLYYPQRGVDNGVILQVGRGARTLTREVDSQDFANAIRMTGKAPDGGGAEPPPYEAYATNLANAAEGRWDAVIGTDLTTGAAVKDRIDWQLGESQTVRPSYTCDLSPGWWGGPSHVWLGDPVRLIVYRGRLRVDSVMRVHEIAVAVDEDGDENVALTLNAPRPDPRRRASDVERRLDELERR